MKHLLRYLELILTGLGLVVVCLVPRLLHLHDFSFWQISTIAATLVGALHGVLIFVVRNRQRRIRHEAIAMARNIIDDKIRNQLQIVVYSTYVTGESLWQKQVMEAVEEIDRQLTTLDEESIQHYVERFAGPAEPLLIC